MFVLKQALECRPACAGIVFVLLPVPVLRGRLRDSLLCLTSKLACEGKACKETMEANLKQAFEGGVGKPCKDEELSPAGFENVFYSLTKLCLKGSYLVT